MGTRKAAAVSPNGDCHGANIHSGLPEHRDLSGCGSVPADTHSLGPGPQCSCSKPGSRSFPGMPSHRVPAPRAAILPQEGTLQEDCLCQLWIQPGSPAPLHTPWELDLTSSYAASSSSCRLSAGPLPPTHSSNPGPRQPSLYIDSAHLTAAPPAPCHILPAGQTFRVSLLPILVLVAGPPSFCTQAWWLETCKTFV